jgi:hypothetical protein
MEAPGSCAETWGDPVTLLEVVLAVLRGQHVRWNPDEDETVQALRKDRDQSHRNAARLRRVDALPPLDGRPGPAQALWHARNGGR